MRRRVAPLVLGSLLVASAGAASGAAVEGRVALPAAAAAPVVQPRYAVGAGYTVGEPDPPVAIVYLEGDFAAAGAPRPAEVAQRRYQFSPGLVAVPRGGAVRFPNRDEEYHSVFSYSKARRFDLGRYRRDEAAPELRFEQAGVVRLFCEIHDHMRGTILVLDTPYFTRTAIDGTYRLDGLPAGRFVLKAWIDEDTVREQPVELRDGATARVDFPPS